MSDVFLRFYELLQHEMCKVNRFFELHLRTLLDKLREAQRALHSVKPGEGALLRGMTSCGRGAVGARQEDPR